MIEHFLAILTTTGLVLHWSIIIGLGLRILLKRRSTGVSLAWLLLITSVPFVGALIYLLVGELWLPRRRIRQVRESKSKLRDVISMIENKWELSDAKIPELARGLNAQTHAPLGLSALSGNRVQIYDSIAPCIRDLVRDIDDAKESVNMLFYIWQSIGLVEQVEEALKRAAARGVKCRLLLDGAGSGRFLRSRRAGMLHDHGIEIVAALPVSMLRMLFKRIDIRNHRKIVAIDHRIAYTGSMNMVDPAYFNIGQGVGQWVDVMSRVEGPAAKVLAINIALDWSIENQHQERTEEFFRSIQHAPAAEIAGHHIVQVVPSGPDQSAELIHQMLVTLIYNARKRLVITTPYFIPGESMLEALISAAQRGVRVSLVIPEKIDSLLVRHACRAYFADLLEAGVEIYTYRGGLLHAKTVTADDDVALLGSVNMDKRSFSINFEISLFVYDKGVLGELRSLQESYAADSTRIESVQWGRRPVHRRLVENAVQLLAPIL